jgi:hypothetical protein
VRVPKPVPVHPVLLALLPVLALFVHNSGQVEWTEIIAPALVAILAAVLIFVIAFALSRDVHAAAVITSMVVVVLSWYDPARNAVEGILGVTIQERYALLAAALVLLAAAVPLFRRPKVAYKLTAPLNLFCVILLAMLALRQGVAAARSSGTERLPEGGVPSAAAWNGQETVDSLPRRDIYYIILDGYAREDVLRDVFSFDNTPFLAALRSRGFYVNPDSRSNYALTFLSLASSLNGMHVDHLASLGSSEDRAVPYEMIAQNRVMTFLRDQGYTIVSFNSGWGPTRSIPAADRNVWCGWTSEFVEILLRQTALWPFLGARVVAGDMYESRLCQLRQLAAMRDLQGPKFVFAHLLVPHPPYVFQLDGQRVEEEFAVLGGDFSQWAEKRPYVDQLRFVNDMILAVLDSLLAAEGPAPVIVLQSDHGSAVAAADGGWASDNAALVRERMPILNALFLPGVAGAEASTFLTPVNTFPGILNLYFGTHVKTSPDVSYYSWYKEPYRFTMVDSMFGGI